MVNLQTERCIAGAWKAKHVDHYAILGVWPDASDKDIALAYHALARALHPDINSAQGIFDALFFRQLTQSYNTLKRKETKEKYDKLRKFFMRGYRVVYGTRLNDNLALKAFTTGGAILAGQSLARKQKRYTYVLAFDGKPFYAVKNGCPVIFPDKATKLMGFYDAPIAGKPAKKQQVNGFQYFAVCDKMRAQQAIRYEKLWNKMIAGK